MRVLADAHLSGGFGEAGVRNEDLENLLNGLKDVMGKPRKNSRTSSRKPSSDDQKDQAERREEAERKRPEGKGKGSPGPKPEHEPANRPPLKPEDADRQEPYFREDDKCPKCKGKMEERPDDDKTWEMLELPEKPIERILFRRRAYWCGNCKCMHWADEPRDRTPWLFGPRLMSLLTCLKVQGSMSVRNLQDFLAAMGAKASVGVIQNSLGRSSDAVGEPYEELVREVAKEKVVNSDESHIKMNGRPYWAWVMVTAAYILFVIRESRGSAVLEEILGEDFSGVLGSDFFSAYKKFSRLHPAVVNQFCLVHLKRQLKDLAVNYGGERRRYGEKLLELLDKVFELHHSLKDEFDLNTLRLLFKAAFDFRDYAVNEVPCLDKLCMPIARRLAERFEAHFIFILWRDVEPTNNLAEQAIRHLVIDRHVTQGVRSERGAIMKARLMTVRATCRKRGLSPFRYVYDCLVAMLGGEKAPSMLTG
ncbi:MAG: IS66 family transposase [Deltaproteobacteria bacterium]|nr:IS66 family transposase [Deltaproteobacteria bacterium]